MSEVPTAVLMKGITKRFAGVVANSNIDFEVREGEIHALLGENGAGKTTLMNILYGIYRPDEGEIYIYGKKAHIHSPKDAIALGIGMVHQQFRLVQTHTVVENIVLGTGNGLRFEEEEVRQKIVDLAQRYSLAINPDARIWQLSAGEQQRVEILKALYRGAKILILDEPTSMLTPLEIKELLQTLRRMTEEGNTIIFITHKLDEVTAVSHRVTILRQGKVTAVLETAKTNKVQLANLMVGREVLFRLEKPSVERGSEVLRVEGLEALSDKGLIAVNNVSFTVHRGEILGIAGVAGNGQRELLEVIAGLRPATRGKIFINGVEATRSSIRERINMGMSYVPGERMTALVPNMSIAENMILKSYRTAPISKGAFIDRREMLNLAQRLIQEYEVITPGPEKPVKLLSGGNIQRALMARELSQQVDILVAAYPTSGLDVGAIETIWRILLSQRPLGKAILLVSDDLEEILTLSDRVAVMHNGEIMGIVEPKEENLEKIGLMMAGALKLEQEQWV
ncbi:MAG: ABC transporter ATP-binding protein [Anaerolineales bacterium]|nr:ABC transporter ATP-binding protein [Anaerolineales bacterium]MCS7248124.1 ABC transporter ATP-binding protein [Anaerolineales bacterium]MDW8161936.1 ABC transporter ATP-binding protein [Anaerolineales bacterium]MDW8448011.1 ABC transporter ATP-binding protein [Anaerolineales bacterium]